MGELVRRAAMVRHPVTTNQTLGVTSPHCTAQHTPGLTAHCSSVLLVQQSTVSAASWTTHTGPHTSSLDTWHTLHKQVSQHQHNAAINSQLVRDSVLRAQGYFSDSHSVGVRTDACHKERHSNSAGSNIYRCCTERRRLRHNRLLLSSLPPAPTETQSLPATCLSCLPSDH